MSRPAAPCVPLTPRLPAFLILTAVLVTGCSPAPPPTTAAEARSTGVTLSAQRAPHPGSAVTSTLSAPRWVNPLVRPADLFLPPGGTRLTMQAAQHDFGLAGHRLTTVWGYAAPGQPPGYLGPTLRVTERAPTQVLYRNALPDRLPFALVAGQPGPPMTDPTGFAVPHLHGGHTEPDSDGLPEQSFAPGTERAFTYRNDQRGATLWYHDHAMGLTRANVYAGLAGFYLLRDPQEAAWNLPWADPYDVPLVLQDKAFNRDGSLNYPASWVPEFFGDVAVVNGKAFPQMDVEPRRYRLRLLNGSNARFYDLTLDSGAQDVPFQQIGADGGLLPEPVTLEGLLIAPGERADVLVNFSGLEGRIITLENEAGTPYTGDSDRRGGTPTLPALMRFRVGRTVTQPDRLSVPATVPANAPDLTPAQVVRTRYLTLNEQLDPATGAPQRALLGTLDPHTGAARPLRYHDPVTETPRVNDVEEWVFINNTGDVHPIHVHQLQFMVLERAAVTRTGEGADPASGNPGHVAVQGGAPVFQAARPPETNERGWKDTVIVYPGEMTRIRLKFDLPGRYVWHCHILEHEENDMMRPIQVLAAGETAGEGHTGH